MKFFNTAGPIQSDIHYQVNPLERWNMDEIIRLIDSRKYFVLHAPRQTGKTSAMLALMNYLNEEGKYYAVYINIEAAQAARENVRAGMESILYELSDRFEYHIGNQHLKQKYKELQNLSEHSILTSALSQVCKNIDKPVVLLLDEVDALIGDTLISLLRQLRSSYDKRPVNFPQSVILCGVRDVRDYRIHSAREKTIISGGSAFNIKAKSLRLGNFSKDEIKQLLDEHTKETGQKFEDGITELFWKYTEGQPWLVNALAYELTYEMKANRNHCVSITKQHLAEAKENLILRRDTHLDQLIDKLKEDRVKRVIQPMLQSIEISKRLKEDDIRYVADLGLIKLMPNGKAEIANDIYKEIIPRELAWTIQTGMSEEQQWYVDTDSGKLKINKLLISFQSFFRKHSESWIQMFEYYEAGPQLLLQAFLQRIINGGGSIDREYGLGRKRTDLYIKWDYNSNIQEFIIELKIKYNSLEKTIEEGLQQTQDYMDKCGTKKGHLIIFDRTKNKTWDEKIFVKDYNYKGNKITVWGM